ncbi:equilibrative nucleoside transporter family protein (macronuclear) [Tetrahymena thermophila SB210]|uniref:Equilibrative nucleoside transporter family protein n=1 Tax=Tetrahymena thermophila (strain SB210) TaxID=312017 RepID=Q23PR2_TETTS|nr:equilibrative nucleoside transporter family protein [Tetrahymena thermophila SB210]EAR98623.1 equilibrative nucleoside transporter family protein [Tetrahymena thermophila SB210]|eukprot:XP_001018868.1 equilibrative nucleoside transporter family protein [Tetrahymena thermophila SB210]
MKQKISDIAKHTPLTKITFALLGTNTLLGWSAVLTSFDYFSDKFPQDEFPDVAFYFPIPLKIGTFIWTFAMAFLMKHISLKFRICGFIAIQGVLMMLLPIIANYMQTNLGYALMITICFLVGSTACIVQNSNLALVSNFDKLSLKLYWVFTSITQLIMNLCRAIILVIFGDNQEGINTGIFVYYAVADLVMIITIISVIKFLKTSFYLDMLEINKLQLQNESENTDDENQVQQQESISNLSSSQIQHQAEQSLLQKQNKIQMAKNCFMKVKFICFSILLTYIIQYMLFPGVAVFQKQYHMIHSKAWATLSMQIVYSVGDLVGKYLSTFNFYNTTALYAISLSRLFLFFTFLMIAHDYESSFFQNDIFAFINIFSLSFTNGFVTGGFMTIGPQRGSNNQERSLISIIQTFFLTFGISVGTFLALTLKF